MIYEFRVGSHISGVDPNVAGEITSKLADENRLTAGNLVDISRPQDAPLHDYFEWDDAIAGEEWRKSQARHLINCIVYREEKSEEEKTEPVRAYYTIAEGKYEPTQVIIRDDDKRRALKEMALKELVSFKRKYKNILKQCGIEEAVDEIQMKIEMAM